MKKKLLLLALILCMLLTLAACCRHETWADADCVTPKTCAECGETEGEPLGHDWQDATCDAPKTCSRCGETDGEPLPHTWVDATCTDPKTCSVCQATEGEALGHSWVDATYETPKTCSVCQATEGEALVRTDLDMTNDEAAQALSASLELMGLSLEYWGTDEDGWPVYDVLDTASGAYTNVYISFEPTADGSKVLSIYSCAEDVNDYTAVAVLGATGTVALLSVDPAFDTAAFQQMLAGEPQIVDNVSYYYMEDQGLAADLQIHSEFVVLWVYPAGAE